MPFPGLGALMFVHKIIKGSTVRLGYAITQGDPNTVAVFNVRLRQRLTHGLSTIEIILPTEIRAAGIYPAGFDVVLSHELTSSLKVDEYQLDMLLAVAGGEREPAPSMLIVVKA